MARGIIVAISGRIGAGKSTLGRAILNEFESACSSRSTSRYIASKLADDDDVEVPQPMPQGLRKDFQDMGHELDTTNPGWIRGMVTKRWITVIDCVRRISQVNELRKLSDHRVIHFHVDTPESTARGRRPITDECAGDRNESENNLSELRAMADLVTDSGDGISLVVLPILRKMRRVDALIGGQYGSEGKGHIVSYLANEYDIV